MIPEVVRGGRGLDEQAAVALRDGISAAWLQRMNVTAEYHTLPQYQTVAHWAILSFVGVGVMIGLSITTCVLRFFTTSPEILGYVGASIRFNERMNHLVSNSGLDGTALARELRHEKIVIGDLQPNSQNGKVGLKSFGMARPLDKKRLYQ